MRWKATFSLELIIRRWYQNRDTSALHAKVDALICAIKEADDEMIRIEDGSDDQLARAREMTRAASGKS